MYRCIFSILFARAHYVHCICALDTIGLLEDTYSTGVQSLNIWIKVGAVVFSGKQTAFTIIQ